MISELLKVYMVVKFRTREINQSTNKLARSSKLINNNKVREPTMSQILMPFQMNALTM
jgi:hypothetical protein